MRKSSILYKGIIIVIATYLLIPLILTFIYSVFNEWTSILPSGFTFKYYEQILSDPLFIASLLRSLVCLLYTSLFMLA